MVGVTSTWPARHSDVHRRLRSDLHHGLDHQQFANQQRPSLPSLACSIGSWLCSAHGEARPHRSLQLGKPRPTGVPTSTAPICLRDILNGLIHKYERAA